MSSFYKVKDLTDLSVYTANGIWELEDVLKRAFDAGDVGDVIGDLIDKLTSGECIADEEAYLNIEVTRV